MCFSPLRSTVNIHVSGQIPTTGPVYPAKNPPKNPVIGPPSAAGGRRPKPPSAESQGASGSSSQRLDPNTRYDREQEPSRIGPVYTARNPPKDPTIRPPPGRGRSNPPVINQLPTGPRLQAFAVPGPSTSQPSTAATATASSKTAKQLETRQRQLEMLRRMEERYKSMGGAGQRPPAPHQPTAAAQPARPADPAPAPQEPRWRAYGAPYGDHVGLPERPEVVNNSCACQRLTVHVLDITEAVTEQVRCVT